MSNASYSTTRMLIQEMPVLVNNYDNAFETVLFLPGNKNSKAEGGLRTKGYFKKSYEHKPLISIVTVVYNGEKYLEQTIQSVINQSYDNVEYIVIDGGSTDGTLDIVKKYVHAIDYWVSEPDKGIYDAMNKGISIFSGDWINFMNAGDTFLSENTVENIIGQVINRKECEVIYGRVLMKFQSFEKKSRTKSPEELPYGMVFGHQALFLKRSWQLTHLYDTKYKICADYDLICRLYIEGASFCYIDDVVSVCSSGGVSDRLHFSLQKEVAEISSKYFSSWKIRSYHLIHLPIAWLKEQAKKTLPGVLVEIIRRYK